MTLNINGIQLLMQIADAVGSLLFLHYLSSQMEWGKMCQLATGSQWKRKLFEKSGQFERGKLPDGNGGKPPQFGIRDSFLRFKNEKMSWFPQSVSQSILKHFTFRSVPHHPFPIPMRSKLQQLHIALISFDK
jgi:hypothetical protein